MTLRMTGAVRTMTKTIDTQTPAGHPLRQTPDGGAETAAAKQPVQGQGSAVSARWRIVGWIVVTTALTLLAVTVTMRSVMSGQIAEAANAGITQEIQEFRTFAAEGLDPQTAKPFTSMDELMERYVARQQPVAGEAIIGEAGQQVYTAQGALDQAGDRLAADHALLQRIVQDPQSSGVYDTSHGPVRWAKAEATGEGTAVADPSTEAHLVVAHFTGAAQEQADRHTVLLLAIAAGGLALTAGIAWLVARHIMRPIRAVRETAEQITAQDLSARIPVHGRDDLAQLAETVNAMLDRVEGSHLAQRHFIAEARAHLSEPQHRLAVAVRELAREELSTTKRSHMAAQAQDLIGQMGQCLADLEILAQSTNPGFVAPQWVSVGEVTAQIAAQASGSDLLAGRHLAIEATSATKAWLDPARITDALRQLIGNAVRFTGPGDTIHLGSAVTGGAASFWVQDHGAGLEAEQARSLLESYRTQGADRGQPGMGLGLAVVKAVAEAHRGSAWVESGAGQGTCFGISFGADALAPAAAGSERFADCMASTLGAES